MHQFRLIRTLALSLAIVAFAVAVPVAAQAPAPAAPTQNVLDMLKTAGTFTMFVKAVEEAGLASTFTGSGPLTVLAPTDAAFAKVPKANLDAAMANKAQLTTILKNHIIEGQKITVDQLKTQKALKTSAGLELQITVQDGVPSISGARVVRGDVQASNGVIHTLDTVLIPKP